MEPHDPGHADDLRLMRGPTTERTARPAMTIEERQRAFRRIPSPAAEAGATANWVRTTPASGARRKRCARGIFATAVILAVLLLAVSSLSHTGVSESDDPLDQVVGVAVNPPVQARPEPDRPVLHLVYEITGAGAGNGAQPDRAHTEMWHAWRRADGSGREDRAGQPRTIGPASGIITPGEARVEEPGVGEAPASARDDGTAGTFSATIGGFPINQSLIDQLPRDPSALRAKLTDLVAPEGPGPHADDPRSTALEGVALEGTDPVDAATRDARLFRGATDLLVSWLAPPALRSAALEIAGNITGVTVKEGRDQHGQRILIMTLVHDGRTEVFLDPVTSAVTGHRVVDADGAVTHELQLVAADWVAVVPDP